MENYFIIRISRVSFSLVKTEQNLSRRSRENLNFVGSLDLTPFQWDLPQYLMFIMLIKHINVLETCTAVSKGHTIWIHDLSTLNLPS